MSPSNQPSNTAPTVTQVLCPRCNEPIDLVNVVPANVGSTPQNEPVAPSPFIRLGRVSSRLLMRHAFPFATSFEPSAETDTIALTANWSAALRTHWKAFAAFVASIVIICLVLIVWGTPLHAAQPEPSLAASVPQSSPVTTTTVGDATRAVLLDTLIEYNRAETEAAALLSITPLRPLLAPDGPLAQRRTAQIAERAQRHAPHRTMLLRWAIGEVGVSGDTATVVTQETWSNQEVNAVAPEQATVRFTYTLHWNATARRWLIVESKQTTL